METARQSCIILSIRADVEALDDFPGAFQVL